MRGSDAVDIVLDVVPRRIRDVLVAAALMLVVAFGYTRHIEWYIWDKAQGLVEILEPALQEAFKSMLPAPSHDPASNTFTLLPV